jgi:hypothetical protein
MKFELWIDGYSNCGTRIKTAAIKSALQQFQQKYPERNYELQKSGGFWFIKRVEAK